MPVVAAADPIKRIAWVFPGLFVVLWSTGFIGAKLGLPYVEPATFLEIRFAAVLAVLLPICLLARAPWPSSAAEFWHMAFAGALIQGGYLGGVFLSLHQGMPAGVSSLITALQPILAAVLSSCVVGSWWQPAHSMTANLRPRATRSGGFGPGSASKRSGLAS